MARWGRRDVSHPGRPAGGLQVIEPTAVSAVDHAYSVVIPARNAARTIDRVLASLAGQEPPPAEVIVVDDGSTDETASIAAGRGARVIGTGGQRFAGGARNLGWAAASGKLVVFLDSDVIPRADWGRAIQAAVEEFPGCVIGCARTFSSRSRWGWVAHLQVESTYLPGGEHRFVPFVSSFCMVVPRDTPVRWDESYGGEDALFCADVRAAGMRLVFDPRIVADHDHERESFSDLRRQQRRTAYGYARGAHVLSEGLHKRVLSRVPLHYFALVRLIAIERRLRGHPELHRRFLRLLPLMVVAEWTLGLSAMRYIAGRPRLRGGAQPTFS
jgi:glycosyltransferase involved in cell wall biosynthesis